MSTKKTNYSEIAKEVTEIEANIAGTIIVQKGSLIGSYTRPKMPIPNKEKFGEMFLQAELMISISQKNADVFGKVEAVIIQHGILHVFVIPFADNTILALAIQPGYNQQDLMNKIIRIRDEYIN